MRPAKESAHDPIGIGQGKTSAKVESHETEAATAQKKSPGKQLYATRHEEAGRVQPAPVKNHPRRNQRPDRMGGRRIVEQKWQTRHKPRKKCRRQRPGNAASGRGP